MTAPNADTDTRYLKATLDLCLLAMIEYRDSYGYELVKELRATGYPLENEGSAYALLKRLEADELVESYLRSSDGGPARKYYRITAEGQKTLRQRAAHSFGLFEKAREIISERVNL